MIASILNIIPLIGRQATKAEVMKRMSSVGLIHIAAHGNELTGEIALSPSPGWTSKFPQEEDFILKMSDVQAANPRARLMVLSCCHSGRGRILKGEGVVGIARAFLRSWCSFCVGGPMGNRSRSYNGVHEKFLSIPEERKNCQCCCSPIDKIPS